MHFIFCRQRTKDTTFSYVISKADSMLYHSMVTNITIHSILHKLGLPTIPLQIHITFNDLETLYQFIFFSIDTAKYSSLSRPLVPLKSYNSYYHSSRYLLP